jgi:hypothetical protein
VAFDCGLTPKEFMERHNPMFRAGSDILRPYVTRVECFAKADYQIVFINNSSAPYTGAGWQGTLHAATIQTPDESQRRIINSTMLAPVPCGTPELQDDALREFMTTTQVRRQGYDKKHLDDDG